MKLSPMIQKSTKLSQDDELDEEDVDLGEDDDEYSDEEVVDE
ncbi:DNA-directed RNA polymerase delta subunit [Streptococcus suis YB51]|nr:DNA-directed RNA polymerase delta subunit [Streptococcus suis YB51]